MSFKNKVVIVTGATGGIGKEIVSAFKEKKAKVIAVGRRKRKLEKLLKEIGNDNIYGILADISKPIQIKRLIKEIVMKFGTIDVLINCAGIQKPIGPFVENDFEDWIKNIKVNLLGPIMLCREVLPIMIKNRKGRIINFSGGGATSSRPNFSAYAVAKTGIVRFTEILADEVRKYNIQVNAVAPGMVKTNMLEEILIEKERAGEEVKRVKKCIKENKITHPELVAELVLFLASGKSDGLSGRLISVVWDDWKNWSRKDIKEILKTDKYTLRRIK